ncbi:MAG: glycosyltransferase family 9 protein [Candidatus Thorarchaeota archaeon]
MAKEEILLVPWQLGIGNLIQALPALRLIHGSEAYSKIHLLLPRPKLEDDWVVDAMQHVLESFTYFQEVKSRLMPPADKIDRNHVFTTRWQSAHYRGAASHEDIPWYRRDDRRLTSEHQYFLAAALQFLKKRDLTYDPGADAAETNAIYWHRKRALNAACILVVNSGSPADYKHKYYPRMASIAGRLYQDGYPIANVGPDSHKMVATQYYLDLEFATSLDLIHANCSATITNDCLWAHVSASLLGLPTFILYGPTSPGKNHPWGPKVTTISDTDCLEHSCAYKSRFTRCQKRICWTQDADAVVELVLAKLDEEKQNDKG